MRTFIYFVILTLCAVLLESCTIRKKPVVENLEKDTTEQFIPYVPTVYDVLQEREDWKYQNFIDSVYLSMPEQIITQMLVTKGTTISHTEIVEDYLKNKQFYHDTILKSMDIQKKYIPDSLPNKDKPDKQLNKSDTVNKINNNR
ncbi:MAG: hypothetical protein IKY26_05990 [Erysipelotrichaceae bacterium]|nr:hypothetical protein [Erysipelotrichaceae bacterium]